MERCSGGNEYVPRRPVVIDAANPQWHRAHVFVLKFEKKSRNHPIFLFSMKTNSRISDLRDENFGDAFTFSKKLLNRMKPYFLPIKIKL